MKKQIVAVAVAVFATWWVTACGTREAEGTEAMSSVPGEAMVADSATPPPFVEREFWLALAEEPGWHLNVARELYLDGKVQEASEELSKVAAILNFESRHSHSAREEGMLLGSVEELREVAREVRFQEVPFEGLPDVKELDRVSALAFRSIAAHQATLARDALEAGDARMAGRYITETSNALEKGFERSGTEMGNALTEKLTHAREVASRLEMDGNGSRQEGMVALDHLDEAVAGLSEVLTSGRK